MHNLSNELLIQSYIKAVEIPLHPHFIHLIQLELNYRGINIEHLTKKLVRT
ncbi:MAG TPA: sporulation histidine kinase inhibitor Sda [Firmicutes bacterium]|nr:sporulation histidine kinase inhibitor Sda [Bacillales bacterium]HJA41264.1 sporulation histidine kinase inhibitor Sda [Bacillota bacterium]